MSEKSQQHLPNHRASQAIQSILLDKIRQVGPLRVSDFMQTIMAHPKHGYYRRQNPIGAAGDFTTAAEISGLFGEMCGIYLAHMYAVAGRPRHAQILELGPGLGSLMADVLHAWKHTMPAMTDLPVNLVETSPHLREHQEQRINAASLTWHEDLSSLPDVPLFGLANEFFDALPVDQAVWRQQAWRHRLVAEHNGTFGFIDGNRLSPHELVCWQLENDQLNFTDGAVAEYSQATDILTKQLANRIAIYGGAFLVIDYGKNDNYGDSLQAVAAHKPVDLFYQPGNADISHWVDFSAIRRAASDAGARFIGPVTQANFLMTIGVRERAENAALTCDARRRRVLFSAVDRLVGAHHMGTAFKVGLIVPTGVGLPSGFGEGGHI